MPDAEALFSDVMSGKKPDKKLLKKMCTAGVPHPHRLDAYSFLLGVSEPFLRDWRQRMNIPAFESCRIKEIKETGQKEKCQVEFIKEKYSEQTILLLSNATIHQIEIDVKRVSLDQKMFRGQDLSAPLRNILQISSALLPETGYAQGMADILVPFVQLVCEEYKEGTLPTDFLQRIQPRSFYLYFSLITSISHNLIDLFSVPLAKLREVLEVTEPTLLEHMEGIGIEIYMVAFRWFSCLFTRELELDAWYRFFDAAVSSDINEFIVFFGAAIFSRFKRKLFANCFSNNMLFLQALRDEQLDDQIVEELIGSAAYIRGRILYTKKNA